MKTLEQHREAVASAAEAMQTALEALESPQEGANVEALEKKFDDAETAHGRAKKAHDRALAVDEAKRGMSVAVAEPEPEVGLDDGEDNAIARAVKGGRYKRAEWDARTQRVDGEESVYHTGAKFSFVKDSLAAQKGDGRALERILRSARELAAVGRPFKDDEGNVLDERAIAETASAGGELVN